MIWKYDKSALEQTPSYILLTLKSILLMLMTGSSNAHGRVRLYNELHQGHRDARIGEGIFSLFPSHINGTNSSLKGVLPDLHLVDGLGVHEPATWVGCLGYCWIGKGLLREWSEFLYTSLIEIPYKQKDKKENLPFQTVTRRNHGLFFRSRQPWWLSTR